MTPNDIGLKLRRECPELNEIALSNAQLGQYLLNRYPKLYKFISPTAERVKEITEDQFASSRWFEEGRLLSKGMDVANKAAEIEMLHKADLVIKASGMGISVPAMIEMEQETHRTNEAVRKERLLDNDSLDANERARLNPHYLIQRLQDTLMRLIDERDNQSHPDKRKVLDLRIKHLMEELDGRAAQTALQASGRSRLELVRPDSDRPGSGGESVQGDVEPVSVKGFRMGE